LGEYKNKDLVFQFLIHYDRVRVLLGQLLSLIKFNIFQAFLNSFKSISRYQARQGFASSSSTYSDANENCSPLSSENATKSGEVRSKQISSSSSELNDNSSTERNLNGNFLTSCGLNDCQLECKMTLRRETDLVEEFALRLTFPPPPDFT
jgi:hypothetical protein